MDIDNDEAQRFDKIKPLIYAIEHATTGIEPHLRLASLLTKYGNEQYQFEETPIKRILSIFDNLEISPGDVFFDLGSGYGHVVLVGAALHKERFVGVEIVTERHLAARQLRDQFGLTNLDLLNTNVLDVDLTPGNKFYMFSPFFLSTLDVVCSKLEAIAHLKQVTILAASRAALHLQTLKWLEQRPITPSARNRTVFELGLALFRSRL